MCEVAEASQLQLISCRNLIGKCHGWLGSYSASLMYLLFATLGCLVHAYLRGHAGFADKQTTLCYLAMLLISLLAA